MAQLFQQIRQHRTVAIAAILSIALSLAGVFVLYHVLQGQERADRHADQAAQRAYEAQRDAYNAAIILRRAQVDACERKNDLRRELNDRVVTQQKLRNILLTALERAATSTSRSRVTFAALRDELRGLNYHPLPILDCEKTVPKVKLSPPVPPGGVAAPGHPRGSTPSRAMKVKHVLNGHYGEICRTSVYRIPLYRVAGLRWQGRKVDGLAVMNRFPDPTRCAIYIERNKRFSTEDLCILWGHELGHFRYGPDHSRNPRSIMHTPRPDYWRPCSRRFR